MEVLLLDLLRAATRRLAEELLTASSPGSSTGGGITSRTSSSTATTTSTTDASPAAASLPSPLSVPPMPVPAVVPPPPSAAGSDLRRRIAAAARELRAAQADCLPCFVVGDQDVGALPELEAAAGLGRKGVRRMSLQEVQVLLARHHSHYGSSSSSSSSGLARGGGGGGGDTVPYHALQQALNECFNEALWCAGLAAHAEQVAGAVREAAGRAVAAVVDGVRYPETQRLLRCVVCDFPSTSIIAVSLHTQNHLLSFPLISLRHTDTTCCMLCRAPPQRLPGGARGRAGGRRTPPPAVRAAASGADHGLHARRWRRVPQVHAGDGVGGHCNEGNGPSKSKLSGTAFSRRYSNGWARASAVGHPRAGLLGGCMEQLRLAKERGAGGPLSSTALKSPLKVPEYQQYLLDPHTSPLISHDLCAPPDGRAHIKPPQGARVLHGSAGGRAAGTRRRPAGGSGVGLVWVWCPDSRPATATASATAVHVCAATSFWVSVDNRMSLGLTSRFLPSSLLPPPAPPARPPQVDEEALMLMATCLAYFKVGGQL